jgi:hypothetical protein
MVPLHLYIRANLFGFLLFSQRGFSAFHLGRIGLEFDTILSYRILYELE